MTPAFQIFADGRNVTEAFNDRLLSLTVTDEDGLDSDAVEITVDDRDNVVALPRKGASLTILMGYRETGLSLMGRFTVDEVTIEGPPWEIGVHGRAADLRASFKEQKTRHFEGTTLGAIFEKLASEHGLEAAIDPELAKRAVRYVAQTEESDLHFATRLARRHDAVAKPANGRLVVAHKGAGRSGSGQPLERLVLRPGDVTHVRVSKADRPDHGGVEAEWYDRDGAERRSVLVENGEGPRMRLPHTYPSEEEAVRAAEARSRELDRAEGSLSVEMPGRTDIAAEMQVDMVGFRDGIAGAWTIERAEHRLDDGGYVTSFEAGKGKKKEGGEGDDGDDSEE